jgi:hypothetical protein
MGNRKRFLHEKIFMYVMAEKEQVIKYYIRWYFCGVFDCQKHLYHLIEKFNVRTIAYWHYNDYRKTSSDFQFRLGAYALSFAFYLVV